MRSGSGSPRRPKRRSSTSADAESYRAQLAYVLERSDFYREKLGPSPSDRLEDIAELALTEKDELRATVTAENPFGAHLCADPSELVRIYSTSGTTGAPSYIPLTVVRRRELGDRLVTQLRGIGRRARPADRLHVQRGTVRRRRSARRLRAHRARAHPDRNRQHRAPDLDDRDARARRSRPHAFVCRAPGREPRPARVERPARPRRGRAGRRRAGLPRQARGGLGREGDRGNGRRRHRPVALRRVRAAGRDAPRRARLRAHGAHRPRDGRGARAGRRSRGRARPHAPPAPRSPAHPLPDARPRRRLDEPVRLRQDRPAHPLRRPYRRHAHRPRRERLPVGDPRGRERVRARRSAGTSSSGRSPRA